MTYDASKSFDDSQRAVKFHTIARADRIGFIDLIKKKCKQTPGVGNYRGVEKAYARLSLSPTLRSKRH